MRIGDQVAVEGRGGRHVGVITRSDSWNGIWVRSARTGQPMEEPLGRFAAEGRLAEVERAPRRSARRPEPLAALVVAAGAMAALIALRSFAR
jgi:hypothetical protein